jgi:two-component system, chemotaxis family, sensor kinase Cph1
MNPAVEEQNSAPVFDYSHRMAEDRQAFRDFLLRGCHDLRSHLRAVRTNSELLLKAPDIREDPNFNQNLGFLVNGAAAADSLVDALSNYALALQVHRASRPMPAGALLRSVLAKLDAEIRQNDAHVSYDELPSVVCDPDRFMQLIENLLRNALEHSGSANPCIHVGTRKQDGELVFEVRDNGRGIRAEDLERIFRPFERLKNERPGTGLGLAICREIVAGHGGRIWAASTAGAGTSFYFTLGPE